MHIFTGIMQMYHADSRNIEGKLVFLIWYHAKQNISFLRYFI